MGISLFNALSGAANATANAAGGNQAGIAAGNEINQNNLLMQFQLARQSMQDQLAKQTQQANLGKIGAEADEASARASAARQPPPKGDIVLSPGQNAYGPGGGAPIVVGPPDRQPAAIAAAADRQAAAVSAAADKQRAAIDAQSANQTKASAAREYTDALTGYQQVEGANPTIRAPLTTAATNWLTGSQDTFSANEAQAKARVKAAWQAYKDAGGTPADRPDLGLVSPEGTITPPPPNPTGAKPTAKDLVHAAIHGHPLPE